MITGFFSVKIDNFTDFADYAILTFFGQTMFKIVIGPNLINSYDYTYYIRIALIAVLHSVFAMESFTTVVKKNEYFRTDELGHGISVFKSMSNNIYHDYRFFFCEN
jgi:hypothetical protein